MRNLFLLVILFPAVAVAQELTAPQLQDLVAIVRSDKDACQRQLEVVRMIGADQTRQHDEHDREVDTYWRRYTGLDKEEQK